MVEIRPATPDDTTAIRRVATAAYGRTYVDIIGRDGVETLLSTWYDPEALRTRLAAEDGPRTFVAVDDDRVVGYASGALPADQRDREDPVGSLPTLYVHPDHWGEGIGGRLFERARDHVASQGASVMRIRVFADNDVGRGFYEDRAECVHEGEDELVPLGREVPTAVYEAPVE